MITFAASCSERRYCGAPRNAVCVSAEPALHARRISLRGEGNALYPVLFSFYPRDAMLARVFATATCPSVRPSVRLSVRRTPVLCLAERKQMVKCTPSDSPMTLVSRKL